MRIKEIKSLFLKKGWAGQTLSRSETIARLNPILEHHVKLAELYREGVDPSLGGAATTQLAELLRQSRLGMGKLAETIFSCGGVAFTGINDPNDFRGDDPTWEQILSHERALEEKLRKEKQSINHQMRTEAVLQHCLDQCEARLRFLNKHTRKLSAL